jgi:nitric oxide reductase large subunit
MDPVLARFRPLTTSQRRIGKYFLVVAGVLLLQILVGSIMAHYYFDRTSFYGIEVDRFLPFNFLRDVHIQSPIVWIGLSWIGAALFLAPAISGDEPKGQGVQCGIGGSIAQYAFAVLLNERQEDLAFFDQRIEKGLVAKLEGIVGSDSCIWITARR